MFSRIPWDRVNWITSVFLIGTFLLSLTAVPLFIHNNFGQIPWAFTLTMFVVLGYATGMSITVGYHRLFSHRAFEAKWPVRLFTLLFGAATFENSALDWSSDHRRHHKHVDTDDDPYDISKGFFYAHIGWLLFKIGPKPPMNNVKDLEKDPLVLWQHRCVQRIAVSVGLIFPTILGALYQLWFVDGDWVTGAWSGFLILGVLRVVFVQHGTFLINSACHMIGERPYDTRHTARDSWWIAFLTYGEGYHNYHHTFQYDYRNGVKPWQWDPSKWAIRFCAAIGLASKLKRIPEGKIMAAELQELSRNLHEQVDESLISKVKELGQENLDASIKYLEELKERLKTTIVELKDKGEDTIARSSTMFRELRSEVRGAVPHIKALQDAIAS